MKFDQQLNAETDRPYLTVTLEADPEIISERLNERGPHNRFQLMPGSSHAEVSFYRQAADRLIQTGFDVLRVDCNQRPPKESAAFIRDRLLTQGALGILADHRQPAPHGVDHPGAPDQSHHCARIT